VVPENSIVLYVEDDLDDQIIFKECVHLVRPDLICKFAKDGVAALQMLSLDTAKPACIFIDVNMPVMNGQELLGRIKSTLGLSHIPCYMLSTSKNPQHVKEAIAAGANDYLIKPAVYIDFQNLLKRTLQRATA
jgi:CheY-like chemotaxis protein